MGTKTKRQRTQHNLDDDPFERLVGQFLNCADGVDGQTVEAAAANILVNCIDHYQTPHEKAYQVAAMVGFVISAVARDQNPEAVKRVSERLAVTVVFVLKNLLSGRDVSDLFNELSEENKPRVREFLTFARSVMNGERRDH